METNEMTEETTWSTQNGNTFIRQQQAHSPFAQIAVEFEGQTLRTLLMHSTLFWYLRWLCRDCLWFTLLQRFAVVALNLGFDFKGPLPSLLSSQVATQEGSTCSTLTLPPNESTVSCHVLFHLVIHLFLWIQPIKSCEICHSWSSASTATSAWFYSWP